MLTFIKKFLVFILLFTLSIFFFCLLIAFSTKITGRLENNLYGNTDDWGSTYNRSKDLNVWTEFNQNKSRGLILGSSTAYRNINPFILEKYSEINWFNAASSSQTPGVSYLLLKHVYEKSKVKNIDFVILDIYFPMLEYNDEESVIDWIKNSELDFKAKINLFFLSPNFRSFNQIIYRGIKKNVPSKTIQLKDNSNGVYLKNGFVCSTTQKSNPPSELKKTKYQRIKLVNSISKILKFCKKKGMKVIINLAPELNIKNLPLNFTNVIYNDEFNHLPEIFYDTHHMTCDGSTIYSEKLALKLKKLID